MQIAEGFLDYPTFNEHDIQESIGATKSVRKLSSEFKGPVAAWAKDRMRIFGETIIARHVYVVGLPKNNDHRVAWIYHEGFAENGKPYCMHHVACDCSGDIERAESMEERSAIVKNCPGLEPALEHQASAINRALGIGQVLYEALSYNPTVPLEEQQELVHEFIGASLLHLLKVDYEYPRSWIANVESGGTLPNLAAKIYQVTPEDIRWVAHELEEEGVFEVDGEVISLSQREKEKIDSRLAAKELLRQLDFDIEDELAA